jgi:hypothetical protein
MELLASVHWVASQGPQRAASEEEAIGAIERWSPRKKKLFKPEHVRVAWRRLVEMKWSPTTSGVAG